jgi:ubiquinone/menaquinone biosynthesis C-methylase UbiE
MTVVDLCCGDGHFTAPLSMLVDGQFHGVDLDPAMLEQVRREIQRIGAPACSLLEADALDLPTVIPGGFELDRVIDLAPYHHAVIFVRSSG